ncbi:MAG: ribosome-associated translation inhibitor RaiA [Gammaproteobacteria bacterium]|jgi:ribosomal subunit interface protein|nr:ribosome-associated translation inhibitor RaiA [Gammaproteobacteria bacterium]
MTNDIQIVFHNIDQTDALTEAVSKRLEKLERYCDQIISGRIVLDSPHNHHHKGKVYSVSIELHTPQLEVRVNQDQHDKQAHEDLYVSIRDAFNVAERQLRSIDKKHRATPMHELSVNEVRGEPNDEHDASVSSEGEEYVAA